MLKKFIATSALLGLISCPAVASPASSLSIANAATGHRAAPDVDGSALSGTLLWVAVGVVAAAAIAYIVIEINDEGDVPQSA